MDEYRFNDSFYEQDNAWELDDRDEYDGTEKAYKTRKKEGLILLVVVQTCLCLILLLIAFLFKAFGGSFYQIVRQSYKNVMAQTITGEQVWYAAASVYKNLSHSRKQTSSQTTTSSQGLSESSSQGQTTSDAASESELTGSSASDIPQTESQTESAATSSKQTSTQSVNASGGADEDVGDQQDLTLPASVSVNPYLLTAKIQTPVHGTITSPFGFRKHPILHTNGFHTGLDIAAKLGTEIVAAFTGKVLEVGQSEAYGNYIILEHSDGLSTFYAHCDAVKVTEGLHIRQGETIGWVGTTGWSTGPHLHFEIRISGKKVNPALVLQEGDSLAV